MQVPSRQRNSPTPQAVSRRAPTPCHQAGSSLGGPGRPRPGLPAQSACPAPSYSALNQTPWGLGTKDQQVGGAGLGAVRGPARVALTVAGNLIRTIPTVVCSVAPQHVGHTAPIVALAESLLAAACICRAGSRPQSAAATGQGLPLMRRPAFAPLTNLRLCNGPARGSTPSPVGVAGGRLLLLSLPRPALLRPEAGDSGGGAWGRGRGLWGWRRLLTAVGRLLVRLVLAVGDAVARQAEVDALAIGTLELVLSSARGIHRWGGRWGSFLSGALGL